MVFYGCGARFFDEADPAEAVGGVGCEELGEDGGAGGGFAVAGGC